MLLEFLGENDNAEKIRKAVLEHLSEGRIKTPDRGSNSSTAEVGDDIASRL